MNLYLSIKSKKDGILLYVVFFFLISGCAVNPDISPADRNGVDNRLPEKRERASNHSKELGRAFLKEVRKQYQFIKEPEVNYIINRVGERILRSIGTDPEGYHFLVVKEMSPNAFAIPGGYIFITDGLLERINSIEELAGVLAHEIAHVQRDHFFKDEKKILAVDIATIAAILLSQGSLATTALAQATNIDFQLQFSRENEAEADIYALSYLKKSGYNRIGLLNFFETLLFYQRFNFLDQPAYFSTHPDIPSRIKKVESLIGYDAVNKNIEKQEDMEWLRASTIIKAVRGYKVNALIKKIETTNEEHFHYLRGLTYLKKGRIKKAIDEYMTAIKINPMNPLYHADLSQCYLLINNSESARLEALNSIELTKTSSYKNSYAAIGISHGILGIVSANKGEYKEAILHYKEGLSSMPYDFFQYIRLSQVYSMLNDRAREAFYLAIALRLDIEPEKAIERLDYAREISVDDEGLKIKIERVIEEITEEGI
ncbi:MAG: M48 family metalloprotease [Nitrospirota bacterium]